MRQPCPGLELRVAPDGVTFIRLHYSADERLDPATEEGRTRVAELRKNFATEALWRQEMEIDPNAQSGQLIYPEFDRRVHVIPDSKIPKRLCRFCSIDPHPRTPHAILWVGIDAYEDWWVYREIWPSIAYGTGTKVDDSSIENRFTIREYADAIAALEGNEIEWRNPERESEYGIYRERVRGEKIIARYMDQAGKAFSASGESQAEESFASRYSRFGIACSDPYKSHEAGEDAIHELLKLRWHQMFGMWPRLHIAESAQELIFEFEHLRFQKTRLTDERELKQKPVDARRHQIDNLRYLATSQLYYVESLAS